MKIKKIIRFSWDELEDFEEPGNHGLTTMVIKNLSMRVETDDGAKYSIGFSEDSEISFEVNLDEWVHSDAHLYDVYPDDTEISIDIEDITTCDWKTFTSTSVIGNFTAGELKQFKKAIYNKIDEYYLPGRNGREDVVQYWWDSNHDDRP